MKTLIIKDYEEFMKVKELELKRDAISDGSELVEVVNLVSFKNTHRLITTMKTLVSSGVEYKDPYQ